MQRLFSAASIAGPCFLQRNPATYVFLLNKITRLNSFSLLALCDKKSISFATFALFFSFILLAMHTVGLLAIKDKKLLLAFSKNKQCFYLPGGKIDTGETAKQALCREIAEELNTQLEETDLVYYTHITAPAYGEASGIIMEQDCFFSHAAFQPIASAEIGELRYFSLAEYLLQKNKAPGAVMILALLTREGLIDAW